MISKKIGQNFAQYKGNELRLTSSSVTPSTVDEVVIGLRGDKKFKRKVTIFRDVKRNPIEKIFDYSDKPVLKNRVYHHETNFFSSDEFVTSTNVKEYTLNRNIESVARQKKVQEFDVAHVLFEKLFSVTNHFSENIKTGEVILSQVKVNDGGLPNTQLHMFKEFTRIVNGKKDASKQKELLFLVNSLKNQVVKCSEQAQGLKMPVKDSYLAFRALDVDDMKVPITKRFLKERGMQKLNIFVNTDFEPPEEYENLIALYMDKNGSINFNKHYVFPSKTACVGSSRHETEHAWHYFLRAVFTGGDDERTCMLAKTNEHLLHSPAILKEAQDYTEAIANYVPYYKNYELYKNNLIERKALMVELAEQEKYDEQGECIRKTFKHIPRKFL